LKQLAEQQSAKAPPASAESGGFLWFKPRKPKAAPVTNAAPAAAQSEPGKLTASMQAPAKPDAARAAAEEAKATAAAAAAEDTGSAEVRLLLAQARTAMAGKDFAGAKQHLTGILDRDPGNVPAQMQLGVCLFQLGQLAEAEATLRKLAAASPNHAGARSLLGVIHLRQGRIEEAYQELTRAVAIEPRNAEAHNHLGIVMNEKGWATAAEQEVRRALELNPQYADAHFNLAVLYARQKTPRLDLARFHYQKATDLGAAKDEKLEALLANVEKSK
jgi:Flp pilus assembly protein TadD